jgi:methionyl-tRNA synthetase
MSAVGEAKTTFITTPIYYTNDVPHIGHAYTTVAADVLARWRRLCGDRVHLLTGVDEHGEKIYRAAADQGRTPQEHVDAVVPRWREMLELLRIGNDDFLRTTEPRHQRAVQDFMQRLYDNGDLYRSVYSGPYCVSCEAYYTVDELVDGRLCPIHRRPVETLEQENWFFRLSRYQPDLLKLYAERPDFVAPEVRLNEVRSFVDGGLQDVSVTRSAFDWGVPVPWEPGSVFYVWFDALLNYITAIGYGCDQEAFERRWPADVQLVGKDIIRFHAVYWPAMLIAAGLEVPRQVYAHGFLLVGGEKMSKTNATGIRPAQLVDHFGVDCYRYYFLREISFGQDGSFSWESMEQRYTTDLANDLGNLANRVLTMVGSYRGGIVPAPAAPPGDAEAALTAAHQRAVEGLRAFDRLEFKRGLEELWVLVGGLNRYVEARAPWGLNKRGEHAELDTCLAACVDALRVIAILVSPVMPDAAEALWGRLGLHTRLADQRFPADAALNRTPAGLRVDRGALLFPKLPDDA